jgi:hypothetical protein
VDRGDDQNDDNARGQAGADQYHDGVERERERGQTGTTVSLLL